MPTQQSTTASRKLSSRRAVDGVKKRGYCAKTSGKDVPWWQVELKAVYVIKEVEISSVCSGKSSFFKIVIAKKHKHESEHSLSRLAGILNISAKYNKTPQVERIWDMILIHQ